MLHCRSDGRSELCDHPIEGLKIDSTYLLCSNAMRILLIGKMCIHSSHLLIVGSLFYSAHLRSGNRMRIFFVGHVLYSSGDGGSQLLHHAVEYSGIHSTDLFHSHIVGVVLIGSMLSRSGQRSINFCHLGIIAISSYGTNLFGCNTMRVLHIGGMFGSRCQSRIYFSHLSIVGIGLYSPYLDSRHLMGILDIGDMSINLLTEFLNSGIILKSGNLFIDSIDNSSHSSLRDITKVILAELLIDLRTIYDFFPINRFDINASIDQLLNVGSHSLLSGDLRISERSGILIERSSVLDGTNGTFFTTISDKVVSRPLRQDRLPLLNRSTDLFQSIGQSTTILIGHGFTNSIKHSNREYMFVILTGRTTLIGVNPSSTLDNFITKQTHIFSLSFTDLY